jgi:hypothetical protein
MNDFHGASPSPTRTPAVSVVGRAEKFQSLTLGLDGTNPRFPWKPSVTMLTYRLIGTTEHFGINHDEPDQCPPQQARPTSATSAQSSRTTVRLRDGATLLNCDDAVFVKTK